MQRIKKWIDDYLCWVTPPNIKHARKQIQMETGIDIPVYVIKTISGLVVYSSTKPDMKNSGLISLTNVCVPESMLDEVIINRDSIEYISELK